MVDSLQLKNIVPVKKTTVLAVDDNPAALRLLESMLERKKYHVLTAVNGLDALRVMEEVGEEIDIILLDRIMPEMGGIEFCQKIKADPRFRLIPVIMQTAAGRPQEIKEGIEAGVFYYLVKPLNIETLSSIVESASLKIHKYRIQRQRYLERQESMTMVQSLNCSFRTLEEGEKLAVFLSQFFPDPDQVFTGVSELFINAVEHGNLAISYEEKGELLEKNSLIKEVERRLTHPLYHSRKVQVNFEKSEDGYFLIITDEGDGFDWQSFLCVAPERATHKHGRGIAMANMMSFDQLIYNEKGNTVIGTVYQKRQ
ncbi:MAG: two-component system cell cycle response regulator [Desulforhopalus sp.]